MEAARTGAGRFSATLLVAAVMLSLPAPAAAGPGLRIDIRPRSEAAALKGDAVSVRVRTRRAARVRVAAFAGGRVVTNVRELKLGPRRLRRARLRLATGGTAALEACGATRLTVRAFRVVDREGTARPLARASRSLRAAPCPRSAPEPYAAEPENPGRCDWLDPAVCLQPWPNDHFTVRDETTATGRRLALARDSMPRNRSGKPIEPGDYNRNDGFSPGQKIVTKVPGLESQAAHRATRAVPIDDLERAYDRLQPVVVIDTRTHRRHLVWSEVDANPADPADVNLIIRPAVNFAEGARYIVALRQLRDADGKILPAPESFRVYRDGVPARAQAVEERRAHMESLFADLAAAGIQRDALYRVWDFTVASERNLSERALAIRDDAFRRLGDANLADLRVEGEPPAFTIDRVTESGDERIARKVEGRVVVPCYLDLPGCPSGGRFTYAEGSAHGPPQWNPANTTEARFACNIPRAALNGGSRPGLYGHGLLGSRGEVDQGQLKDLSNEHNFTFCATDWIGMACSDLPSRDRTPDYAPNCDIPNVAAILQDLSQFPSLADRAQQGFVNFLYLGRALVHPRGLNAHPAFGGVLDTRRLFYDGNSQGGIMGGGLAALAVDHDRAVLGVPGMNYSTLLRRSVDFDTYAHGEVGTDLPVGLYDSYPNELERPLILSLIQILWDRGEANGYAHHMTSDPLPNTPPHEVLLHVALGDHQVAQVAAEVEARTIGAAARTPWADTGRDLDRGGGHFGIPPITAYPFAGSAIVLWDSGPEREEGGEKRGTPPPPNENVPPRKGEDPHEDPRRTPAARRQKSAFLTLGGRVIDVCGARPCYTGTWRGP